MLTQDDLLLLQQKGISEQQIKEQLHCFETGFPYLKLEASASLGNGILALDASAADHYLEVWDEYLATNPSIVKFVPASGAASRMFKNLFEFLDADYTEPTTDFEKKFFDRIDRSVQLLVQPPPENEAYGRETRCRVGSTHLPHARTVIDGGIGRQPVLYAEKAHFGIVGITQLLLDIDHGGFPTAGRVAGDGELHIRLSRTEPHFADEYVAYRYRVVAAHRHGFGAR